MPIYSCAFKMVFSIITVLNSHMQCRVEVRVAGPLNFGAKLAKLPGGWATPTKLRGPTRQLSPVNTLHTECVKSA